MSAGVCIARVTITDRTYPASFLVLPHCSRDLILGVDFLSEHGAVIGLRPESITLSSEESLPPPTTPRNHALNVIDEQVTKPPISSVIISVCTKRATDLEGVIEGNQHLLVNQEVCVARLIAELRGGKTKVMLTNIGCEYKHVNKGMTAAFTEEIVEASSAFTLTDLTEASAKTPGPKPAFDVNSSLSQRKREQMKFLLQRYKDCFS